MKEYDCNDPLILESIIAWDDRGVLKAVLSTHKGWRDDLTQAIEALDKRHLNDPGSIAQLINEMRETQFMLNETIQFIEAHLNKGASDENG